MAQKAENLNSGSWFDDAHCYDVYAYKSNDYGLWTPARTSGQPEKYPSTGSKVIVTIPSGHEYYEDYVDIHLY